MIKALILIQFIVITTFVTVSCTQNQLNTDTSSLSIIPKSLNVTVNDGLF